jgi:hypothetical protein
MIKASVHPYTTIQRVVCNTLESFMGLVSCDATTSARIIKLKDRSRIKMTTELTHTEEEEERMRERYA